MELYSWAAIGRYLGVTGRTAQLWEHNRNLPVHRMPDKRSIVFTTADELEKWKQGKFVSTNLDVYQQEALERIRRYDLHHWNGFNPMRELHSWKEIAAYLGIPLRTAQLWERTRGLPVHRLPGGKGSVYASPEEVNEWKAGVRRLQAKH